MAVISSVFSKDTHGTSQETSYVIGAGIADVTGPAAEVNLMGYANPEQTSGGIHLRQYSRAFIIGDTDLTSRVVFVSVDACMITTALKREVAKRLKQDYGNVYNESNVLLSGTHTHSGPAGFHQYVLIEITSLGFVQESFDALVTGIVKSIQRAHDSLQPGNIYVNQGELLDSNINRSPTAYLNNPQHERQRYKYDVDKDMVLLKFVGKNGEDIGMINWFAVHCTSMNNTNSLISSDNKGYASILFESDMNPAYMPGKGPFVAAFAQSNEGDVSPNTKGPHCMDTGESCNISTSTCGGKSEMCVSPGPGKDMFESTKIIAENQYKKAKELYRSATMKLSGPVDYRLQYIDMTNETVAINDTHKEKTCKPAMGYSFAAGTTDGPGAFDFTQGDTKGNLFWNMVRNLIHKPSKEMMNCQSPKPVLLATGEMHFPYEWQPSIADIQLLRIGQFVILGVPGEFSTMSGRRLREQVTQTLVSHGLPSDTMAVVAGLANTYTHYVATYEEYQVQRYEGASTIYGPHTLQAYINRFKGLAVAVAKSESVDEGPAPPNLMSKQVSFLPPVVMDAAPLGKGFGDVLHQPQEAYVKGSQVTVTFVSGHPRNNVQLEGTFLTVERQQNNTWTVVATDSSWETRFQWKRTSTLLGHSQVTVTWDIPQNQDVGVYRIQHFGHAKSLLRKVHAYTGTSRSFQVMEERINNTVLKFFETIRKITRRKLPRNIL